MYETYVPIAKTIVVRKPPTIAEIVRQKTDDGARIIDFFLEVMEGRVADAKLCHRIDAAKQLVKYGSKEAADFIAEHSDETCDHCESRKRGPRPRKDESPAARPQHAPGPFGYDFLTLLTEDFLTVLSAVNEDLMIKLVRAQTRDGGTVVEFLDDVMYGRNDSFKVPHRIAAARELISHILRDEHLLAQSVVPAHASVVPAHTPREPVPAQAGIPAKAEPAPSVVPAKAEPAPYLIRGTQRGGEGRSEPADEPVLSTAEEPVLSTAEGLVEEPASYSIRGQCSGDSAVPGPVASEVQSTLKEPTLVHPEPVEGPRPEFTQGPADNSVSAGPVLNTNEEVAEASQLETKNSKLETLPRSRRTRTQLCREGAARAAIRRVAQNPDRIENDKDETPAPAELTPAGSRIEEKETHRDEPDPYGPPIDHTHAGRAPPW